MPLIAAGFLTIGLLAWQDVAPGKQDLESQVRQLVEKLGSESLETRAEVQTQLVALAERAYRILAAIESKDPEIRSRIQEVLRRIRGPLKIWETRQDDGAPDAFPPLLAQAGGALVYATTPRVHLLDRESGKVARSIAPPDRPEFWGVCAAGEGDTLFLAYAFGDSTGELRSVDAKTGRVAWNVALGFERSPLVTDGTRVFLITGKETEGSRHHVKAYDTKDGREIWSRAIPEDAALTWNFSGPALSADQVFVGNLDSGLYAYDAVTGKPAWNAKQPGERRGRVGTSYAPVPVAGYGVVASTSPRDGRVVVVAEKDGAVLWDLKNSEGVDLCLSERGLYVARGRTVQSHDLRSGEVRWKFELPKPAHEDECRALVRLAGERDGVLYIHGDALHAVSVGGGEELWNLPGYAFDHELGGWEIRLMPGDTIVAARGRDIQAIRFNARAK